MIGSNKIGKILRKLASPLRLALAAPLLAGCVASSGDGRTGVVYQRDETYPCQGGFDINGSPIYPQAAAGRTVCGGDGKQWTCTWNGWSRDDNSSCSSSPTTICTGGTDSSGRSIDPAATSLGFAVCGLDLQVYGCWGEGDAGGWIGAGVSCSDPGNFQCDGGADYYGNSVAAGDTYPYMALCGGGGVQYRCVPDPDQPTGGVWEAVGDPPGYSCSPS